MERNLFLKGSCQSLLFTIDQKIILSSGYSLYPYVYFDYVCGFQPLIKEAGSSCFKLKIILKVVIGVLL